MWPPAESLGFGFEDRQHIILIIIILIILMGQYLYNHVVNHDDEDGISENNE